MNNYSNAKKAFYTFVFLNILIFASYGILFLVVKNKTEHAVSVLNDADRDIKKDEFLRNAKFIMLENQEEIEAINRYFVPRNGVPILLEHIERLGRESNVDLVISFVSVEQETRNKDDFKELLKIRLEAVGSWNNTVRFFSILENLPFRTSFESVIFSRIGSEEEVIFNGDLETGSSSWKVSVDFSLLKLK